MPVVGDKVRVLPNKSGQPPREGFVTAVTGTLLHVRWSTGGETSFIPGAGAVTVVGKVRTLAKKTAPRAAKTTNKGTKSASAKKAAKAAKKGTKKSTR